MDRKLKLAKDISTTLKLISIMLNDAVNDLEELVVEIINKNKEETQEDTKPLEQYPIGEE